MAQSATSTLLVIELVIELVIDLTLYLSFDVCRISTLDDKIKETLRFM
ncbi:hypothetical protein Pse7429DRAFT_3137 [Pseudanabaena biceps PCC 7429]|uniref:Uncharacterized protein n=1 Tax=Pseudanabaena biceps PCC 7429 TaxID=927668 RepID=L8MYU6_9CYAN|nr:hypothetical protein Pse7429DRAFT_3137 [Pseudanabaena biceps PCC 7429]